MSRSGAIFALILALGATAAPGLDESAHARDPAGGAGSGLERRLIWTLADVRAGRLDDALAHVSQLVEAQPDFELAQLIRGDLLLALGRPLSAFGEFAGIARPLARPLDSEAHRQGLRDEARARLARFLQEPPSRAVPAELVQLPRNARHAILVDTANYRLYVFEVRDDGVHRLADFYVSIGRAGNDKSAEGDEKTPTGLYKVASYLPGEQLPDMYGPGAFPIDYPNDWDRLQGRTGSGIWIHGTESARYSRPPLSSLGCVTLSNEDFAALRGWVQVGTTPVVLTKGVRWASSASVDAVRGSVQAAVDRWRADWESRDTERYLSHYGASFRTAGMSREAFAAHKRRVNASKSFIAVALDDLAIYGYPGEPATVRVEFTQSYRSDSFRATKKKWQHWRLDDGRWRIVSEG
ncbi:MAG: L,D-transpeptidase family protein [Acidobacteriota bacterium]|nr:L,D-transpeptidase family protein [Acidobacteriota bacterium]